MARAAEERRTWYVVRTNIKCEEKAAQSLRAARYRVYVPKMRKTITHHRTKKQIDRYFLLFNRYIFIAHVDGKTAKSARDCDGVEDVLRSSKEGDWYVIPRKLVEQCMLAQRKGEFDDISSKSKKEASQRRFGVGSRFQVRSNHPFTGFYGSVVKVKGRGVIKAVLEVFGREFAADISPEFIEPVDKAA